MIQCCNHHTHIYMFMKRVVCPGYGANNLPFKIVKQSDLVSVYSFRSFLEFADEDSGREGSTYPPGVRPHVRQEAQRLLEFPQCYAVAQTSSAAQRSFCYGLAYRDVYRFETKSRMTRDGPNVAVV